LVLGGHAASPTPYKSDTPCVSSAAGERGGGGTGVVAQAEGDVAQRADRHERDLPGVLRAALPDELRRVLVPEHLRSKIRAQLRRPRRLRAPPGVASCAGAQQLRGRSAGGARERRTLSDGTCGGRISPMPSLPCTSTPLCDASFISTFAAGFCRARRAAQLSCRRARAGRVRSAGAAGRAGASLLAEVDLDGGVGARHAETDVGVDAERLDAVAVAVHDGEALRRGARVCDGRAMPRKGTGWLGYIS